MNLVLTAMAEETSFETGETKYLLSFNNGLLRIPIADEGAALLIDFVRRSQGGAEPEAQEEPARQERRAPPPRVPAVELPPDHGGAQNAFVEEDAAPQDDTPSDYTSPPKPFYADEGDDEDTTGVPQG